MEYLRQMSAMLHPPSSMRIHNRDEPIALTRAETVSMNHSIALEAPQAANVGLGDLLALIGLPSKRNEAGELSGATEKILRGISTFVDTLLFRALAAQTKGEFTAVRDEVFGQYAGTLTSLAKIIAIHVPDLVVERVVSESFSELEAEFHEKGADRFGIPAYDQAMFTIWTFRRTSRLIARIASAGTVPPHLKTKDEDLARSFSYFALWTQFHLDCLLCAIRFDKPIPMDVLSAVVDGLRAAVNAYGYARQGINLRCPEEEPLIAPYEWDEEDQDLLNSSMNDLTVEALDD